METRCTDCTRQTSLGSYEGRPYCASCLRKRAFSQARSAGEFTDIVERLAALGAAIPTRAGQSAKRKLEMNQKLVEAVHRVASRIEEIEDATRSKNTASDDILATDLDDMLDDGFYIGHGWIQACDYTGLLSYCANNPDRTVCELLEIKLREPAAAGAFEEGLSPLLGDTLTPLELLTPPWADRLREVSAVLMALGLARVVELASILTSGSPPADRFSGDERALVNDIQGEGVRRVERTWYLLKSLVHEIGPYNNRADRLMKLWLLHPTAAPMRDYLALLFDAYTRGRHAESVILCRAILERAIRDRLARLGESALPNSARIAAPVPAEMMKRITMLRGSGVLSDQRARDARTVWTRGNRVVHEDPTVIADAYDTIACTIGVVDELIRN